MVLVVEWKFKHPRWLWSRLHDRFNASFKSSLVPYTRYSQQEDWYPKPITEGILQLFPGTCGPDDVCWMSIAKRGVNDEMQSL
jgi:hypothetical protein